MIAAMSVDAFVTTLMNLSPREAYGLGRVLGSVFQGTELTVNGRVYVGTAMVDMERGIPTGVVGTAFLAVRTTTQQRRLGRGKEQVDAVVAFGWSGGSRRDRRILAPTATDVANLGADLVELVRVALQVVQISERRHEELVAALPGGKAESPRWTAERLQEGLTGVLGTLYALTLLDRAQRAVAPAPGRTTSPGGTGGTAAPGAPEVAGGVPGRPAVSPGPWVLSP